MGSSAALSMWQSVSANSADPGRGIPARVLNSRPLAGRFFDEDICPCYKAVSGKRVMPRYITTKAPWANHMWLSDWVVKKRTHPKSIALSKRFSNLAGRMPYPRRNRLPFFLSHVTALLTLILSGWGGEAGKIVKRGQIGPVV